MRQFYSQRKEGNFESRDGATRYFSGRDPNKVDELTLVVAVGDKTSLVLGVSSLRARTRPVLLEHKVDMKLKMINFNFKF